MSELQIIQGALERAAQRRRLDRALRGLWLGLLLGSVVYLLALGNHRLALAWSAMHKFVPASEKILSYAIYVAIACPLLGFIIWGWKNLQSKKPPAGWM